MDIGNKDIILQEGSTGEDVIRLQNALIKIYFLRGTPDGFFGTITRSAVRTFQIANGLAPTGIVDRAVWEALENAREEPPLTSMPTLRKGDVGIDVKSLQFRLETLGFFYGIADGIFGNVTEDAVKNFQMSRNIAADGIAGPLTWREINNLFAAVDTPIPTLFPTIALNSSGSYVVLLQNMLGALDFFTADSGGVFDQTTKDAVIDFQLTMNLTPDGIVGPKTWDALVELISPDYIRFPLLSLGSTGDDVEILQQKLNILGYFNASITGSFDQVTQNAVKEFQKNANLVPSGIVDRLTWSYLYQTTEIPYDLHSVIGRPTLRLGDSGNYVRELQQRLYEMGFYNGSIDGQFGAGTQAAVKAFQTVNKLTADGVVGRGTWSALVNLYSHLEICGPSTVHPDVQTEGVVIDAGHGGSDPGAIGPSIIEKEYALKISQYMFNRFRELGVDAALTRDSDITLTPEERVNRIKAPFGDKKGVILVSNHLNASGSDGAEVIYALRSTPDLPRKILHEIELEGQNTRSYFQRRSEDDPTKDYYYIMRETTNIEPVLVEYGFVDSPKDDIVQIQRYWDRYAEAVIRAVLQYKNLPYTPPETGKIIYVVRSGDTLFSIANNFGVTVDEIKTLNGLTSNNITVGQQLLIPGTSTETTPPSGNLVYIVKAGDTLSSIAVKFDTTVTQIKLLNNLTSDRLSIGQQLFIPGVSIETPETSPIIHTVVAGDTLYSLARQYSTTVTAIRELNNLTSDILNVGQRLLIPRAASEESPSTTLVYTVRSGDSLYSIANRFNTTVAELRRLNNLTSDLLTIGQKLIVPTVPGANYITHVVASGDTLSHLAVRYNTTVEAIKNANNLTSDRLSIGQQLQIPYSGSATTNTYLVRSGDTLFSIANRFNTTVTELMRLNNMTSTTLRVGQQIIVPA